MSLGINGSQDRESVYFHRDYQNDVRRSRTEVAHQSWLSLSQRVAVASLPFFSLYKPFNFPLALGMGSIRVFTSASELYCLIQTGDSYEISKGALQTAIAVSALAGTILMNPLGMLITTSQDAIIDCGYVIHHLNEGEYAKALERTASLVNNTLYLGVLVTGSLEISAVSLGVQALLGVYSSYDDFNDGRWIEGTSHLLMTAIRAHQVMGEFKTIQIREKISRAVETYLKEEMQQQVKGSSPSRNGVSHTSGIKSMSASKYQKYEAYSVYTTLYEGYVFHIADYTGGMRVVTCLDGGMVGVQSVSVNGVQIAASRSVIWYSNHFVHRYEDGRITSYEHRQICEIY